MRRLLTGSTAHPAIPASDVKGKSIVAIVVLLNINEQYQFERQWAEPDADKRHVQRQKITVAEQDQLKRGLEENQTKVAPDTLTRKAINYLFNQWDHPVRYFENGQLSISNILAENTIRPFAVDRQAWYLAIVQTVQRPARPFFFCNHTQVF